MSLLEEKLRKINEEKQHIQTQIKADAAPLTQEQQMAVEKITKAISSEHFSDISKKGVDGSAEQLRRAAYDKVQQLDVSYEEKVRIEESLAANISGLGPLEDFMKDPDITEIMVLRYDHIVIEKNGEKLSTKARFTDEQHLQNVIQRIVQPVGRQINLSTPIVDARLSDGSRVNATIPPVSVDGATLTIRRFSNKALTAEDYISLGTMDEKMSAFLQAAVKGKLNIIVSGGTNTGKTTLLNMLSGFIPQNEMIVTIEDSCELKLKSPNIRRLEAREILGASERVMPIDIKALVKNALRMNPDRIIVGEIRDGTIVDMISAMSTGHEGSMSTAHANSPANLVNSRIPIFYSMSNTNFSAETQALQIAEALDVIVQIGWRNKKRVITQISEVTEARGKTVVLKDIFIYDANGFHATGYIPKNLINKMNIFGVKPDIDIFEKIS